MYREELREKITENLEEKSREGNPREISEKISKGISKNLLEKFPERSPLNTGMNLGKKHRDSLPERVRNPRRNFSKNPGKSTERNSIKHPKNTFGREILGELREKSQEELLSRSWQIVRKKSSKNFWRNPSGNSDRSPIRKLFRHSVMNTKRNLEKNTGCIPNEHWQKSWGTPGEIVEGIPEASSRNLLEKS